MTDIRNRQMLFRIADTTANGGAVKVVVDAEGETIAEIYNRDTQQDAGDPHADGTPVRDVVDADG